MEQDFNSLHAQREACEAFIKSQRHENWVCLPQAYDDGGISGATMDRPALQQLADIKNGKIDVIEQRQTTEKQAAVLRKTGHHELKKPAARPR